MKTAFKPGDRVRTPDGAGVVRAAVPAAALYPEPVRYKAGDRRPGRKATKYAADEVIYQVVLDGAPVRTPARRTGLPPEPRADNYHESQVSPC